MLNADRPMTPIAAECRSQGSSAAALLKSGEVGRRLVRLANLAAAAHMARATEQIMRGTGAGGAGARA